MSRTGRPDSGIIHLPVVILVPLSVQRSGKQDRQQQLQWLKQRMKIKRARPQVRRELKSKVFKLGCPVKVNPSA